MKNVGDATLSKPCIRATAAKASNAKDHKRRTDQPNMSNFNLFRLYRPRVDVPSGTAARGRPNAAGPMLPVADAPGAGPHLTCLAAPPLSFGRAPPLAKPVICPDDAPSNDATRAASAADRRPQPGRVARLRRAPSRFVKLRGKP